MVNFTFLQEKVVMCLMKSIAVIQELVPYATLILLNIEGFLAKTPSPSIDVIRYQRLTSKVERGSTQIIIDARRFNCLLR